MKCSVIDDEPHALELIKSYIERTPFLHLGECFSNPFKAVQALSENKPDLIFLDINMPELTGIQLLNSLPSPPLVIFTTAYPEFAAESYEFNAVDYLLKPVRYERFLRAVNKAASIFNTRTSGSGVTPAAKKPEENDFIYIKSGTRLVRVLPSDILYVEGAGNYMIFHTAEKKITSLLSMQEAIELLPKELFARIHKSFLVSLAHVEAIEKHDVFIKGKPVPIGSTYRESFISRINKAR